MSWILLLIQLIPTIIKIIEAIRDLITHLPHSERPALRREMRVLAKRHVRALSLAHREVAVAGAAVPRTVPEVAYCASLKEHVAVEDEWRALLDRVREQAGAKR